MSNLPAELQCHDLPECQPRPWRNDEAVLKAIDCEYLGRWIDANRIKIAEYLGDLEYSQWPKPLLRALVEDAEDEQRRNPVEDAA